MLPEDTEAQVFPNAFWNQSSCSGSVSRTGLFTRMAQRRATRIQSRYQTSCSGLNQTAVQTSCSGMAYSSYSVVSPTADQQIGNLVLNGGQTVEAATQRVSPVCNGPYCPLPNPTSFVPLPSVPGKTYTPTSSDLFGLSASNDSLEIPKHILAQVAYEPTFGLGEVPSHILAQIDQPVKVAESFRPTLLKAIAEGRKTGKLSFRDAIRLRVAMLSPAFVERAHELAVTQIAMSGEASDAVPMNEEGMVEAEGINWEGLAKFLEAFIPLLITLLKAFGI
jgi:hypothetical protein